MPRVLGLDFGDRRLGFAISDEAGTMAFPHSVETCPTMDQAVQAILRVARSLRAERLVVGLPLNMNGSSGPRVARTRELLKKLAGRLAIPVDTWDERLSSKSAEAVLIEGGASRRRRKEVIDKLAAQIILQNYLDAHGHEALLPPAGKTPV